ncbi:MAG: guanylate kinase [Bacteroidota bacterium]|nr:guanylate kinase [Bacteroidota bacterium]
MGKGKIIAVSAPSGAGKSTILKSVLNAIPEIVFSISATTRPKRETETDGKEYFFITEENFKEKIRNNEFIEWEKFYDYYYGTLKRFIDDNIESGRTVLLEIDVLGALEVKRLYPEAALIYILPPSIEELEARLLNRKTENKIDLQKRLERAKFELGFKDKFDYLVENIELEKAENDTISLVNKIIYKETVNGN